MPAALLAGWGRGTRLRHALDFSRTALHAMREQLDGIVSRGPVCVVQTNLDGRILLANDRFCTLVGHRADHLRTLGLHDITHPEDRPAHLEQRAKMLATGEPCEFESRLVGADASHLWVTGHLALTHDVKGRPMHVVGSVQDISRRRAAEAALLALTATLEQRVAEAVAERGTLQEEFRRAQRMEALGQLADGVAHDFNNVLQAIAGGARLIQRRPGDVEAVQRLAGLVVDAAERGATVTELLTSFARRGPLQPASVDAAELLTELGDVLAGSLGARINIQVAVGDAMPPIYGDRTQLQKVLVNLAANARDAMAAKFSTGDGERPVLRLAATATEGRAPGLPRGRYVRIDVTDTGPGMDPATLDHATEPFFTTKARGSGTGLGLAVARGFAEQSGGRLTLHSEPGAGTTASLWLPQADPPGARNPDRAPNPVDAQPASIVLVDDDAEVREVLRELLISCGYGVADFGSAALALLHLDGADPAHVLITDLSMPTTDGLALIREARQRRPGLPAILMSGYSRHELNATLGKVVGEHLAFLQKPVRSRDLVHLLSAALSGGTAPPR